MQDKDLNALNQYYSGLYKKFGDDSRSTGYSPEGQKIRYDVLSNIGNLEGKSVLEIGSGLGHFYEYLKNKYKNITYQGLDINPDFIAETQKKYGNIFRQQNILTNPPNHSFDVVFSVGILNTKIDNNLKTTIDLMKAMYEACHQYAGLSMTSITVDPPYKYDYMFYYDPADIQAQGEKITKDVEIIQGYLPHDFVVVLRKKSGRNENHSKS